MRYSLLTSVLINNHYRRLIFIFKRLVNLNSDDQTVYMDIWSHSKETQIKQTKRKIMFVNRYNTA